MEDTAQAIKDKYGKLHDDLTYRYYKLHELTKAEFDAQHRKVWSDMDAELISKGYKLPPQPPRDLAAEIDNLKARMEALENK